VGVSLREARASSIGGRRTPTTAWQSSGRDAPGTTRVVFSRPRHAGRWYERSCTSPPGWPHLPRLPWQRGRPLPSRVHSWGLRCAHHATPRCAARPPQPYDRLFSSYRLLTVLSARLSSSPPGRVRRWSAAQACLPHLAAAPRAGPWTPSPPPQASATDHPAGPPADGEIRGPRGPRPRDLRRRPPGPRRDRHRPWGRFCLMRVSCRALSPPRCRPAPVAGEPSEQPTRASCAPSTTGAPCGPYPRRTSASWPWQGASAFPGPAGRPLSPTLAPGAGGASTRTQGAGGGGRTAGRRGLGPGDTRARRRGGIGPLGPGLPSDMCGIRASTLGPDPGPAPLGVLTHEEAPHLLAPSPPGLRRQSWYRRRPWARQGWPVSTGIPGHCAAVCAGS
jgi:hypothetical protein